jgi:hypothetical protein
VQDFCDLAGGRFGKCRRLWRRDPPRQVEQRLSFEIELGRDLHFVGLLDPEPRLHVFERSVHRQRCRGEHDRLHPVEQDVADDSRDVDR